MKYVNERKEETKKERGSKEDKEEGKEGGMKKVKKKKGKKNIAIAMQITGSDKCWKLVHKPKMGCNYDFKKKMHILELFT